jgi:hypothetical protein
LEFIQTGFNNFRNDGIIKRRFRGWDIGTNSFAQRGVFAIKQIDNFRDTRIMFVGGDILIMPGLNIRNFSFQLLNLFGLIIGTVVGLVLLFRTLSRIFLRGLIIHRNKYIIFIVSHGAANGGVNL